ncbi:hypothetical protein MA16_Dca023155 [Dendrobium catenatum]|uniref:Uncharacterized protein n=1 Tax=Dendrobium catenatum TaxID=906689 RepID=A0A2I0V6Y6_9ASPA|nr:hypothetical protein MA16_Dca023155 [Dendrobium catenatum]
MSRSDQFFFLFFLLYEALASIFAFLSTGTFWRRSPEHMVQVSHPDVHRAGYTFFLFFPPQQIGVFLAGFSWPQSPKAVGTSSSSDPSPSRSSGLSIPELIEFQALSSLEGLELQERCLQAPGQTGLKGGPGVVDAELGVQHSSFFSASL